MGKNEDGAVCIDYMRNTCKRGNKCKYRHPDQSEVKKELQFCHDYQNKMCTWNNCKFIHCSKEDEEHYHQTGELPPGLEDTGVKKSSSDNYKDEGGDIPICRDYQKGECKRGSSCKYRHMSRGDVEYEDRRRRKTSDRSPPPSNRFSDEYKHERYRRWLEHSKYEEFERVEREKMFREREPRDLYGSGRDARDLEEENAILRRKVEELRKTVSDLTATNDVLLEQNARMRALRAETTSAVLRAETHLVNSTATAGVPLAQRTTLGSTTHHTVAATAPVMYPARAAQVPIVADNTLPAPGATLREGTQLIAAPLQPAVLTASMAQATGHVVPMSVGVTASMVTYPMVSQTLRTVMS